MESLCRAVTCSAAPANSAPLLQTTPRVSLVLRSCFLSILQAPKAPPDVWLSPWVSVTAATNFSGVGGSPGERKKIHAHIGSSFPIASSTDPEDVLPSDLNTPLGTSQYFEFFLKKIKLALAISQKLHRLSHVCCYKCRREVHSLKNLTWASWNEGLSNQIS